ncbi:MAG: C40 family peptidase [Gammaproteobacteria bacterium]|nr:C40 family peptidase [Gammaproteobacteria bacterium]
MSRDQGNLQHQRPLHARLCRLAALGACAIAVFIAGCAAGPQSPAPAARTPVPTASPDASSPVPLLDPLRTQVVFTAMQMVGVPYLWGGSTPAGFDCSGLVQYAYSNAGLRLPRTAAGQFAAATPLALENAVAGDLLFFNDRSRTSHVAIYLGEGRFVHAPNGGSQVSLDNLATSYWRTHFSGAGRIIPPG